MVESESPLRLLNKTIPKISGPYSRQLRLNHEDTVALPPITSDESRGNRTALSNLTVKENMRVQFLLQLLDKSEAEEYLSREAELDRSRQQEAAVNAMYDNLNGTLSNNAKKPEDKKKDKYYLARRDEESTPSRDDQYALQTSASVGKKQLFVIKKHKHDEIEEEEEDMLFRKHTRKPLNRSIAAELEHMIAQLRKDPSKRAELEERIARAKARRFSQTDLKNIVENNKKALRDFTPEKKLQTVESRAAKEAERQLSVQETKEKLDKEYVDRKIRIMNRREIKIAEIQEQARQAENKLKLMQKQRHWLSAIAFGARMRVVLQTVHADREKRVEKIMRMEAAVVIQRSWRAHYAREMGRKWRKNLTIVNRQLRKWILRWRITRRHRAADLIYAFLNDLQDVTRIVKIVKRFRFLVTQCQVYWKHYHATQDAQLDVLVRQWDIIDAQEQKVYRQKMEEEQRKEEIIKNALQYTSTGKKKRATTNPAARNLISRGSISRMTTPVLAPSPSGPIKDPVKVSEAVKRRVLLKNLRERFMEYAAKLSLYKEQLAKYLEEERQRTVMEYLRRSVTALEKKESFDSWRYFSFKIPIDKIPKPPEELASTRKTSEKPATPAKSPAANTERGSGGNTTRNMLSTRKNRKDLLRSTLVQKAKQIGATQKAEAKATPKRKPLKSLAPAPSAETGENPFVKPEHPGIFRVLLSREEMIQLIQQGREAMEKEVVVLEINHPIEENDNDSTASSDSDDIPDLSDLEMILRTMTTRKQ